MIRVPRPSTLDGSFGERAAATPLNAPKAKTAWEFKSSVGHPMEWTGEGERCAATWPPTGRESSQRCELQVHTARFRHVLSSPL